MTDLISLAGVSVSRGGRDVVRDVDLTVGEGEIVAVLGPNGAGKSTLLEAVGGVIGSRGALHRHGRVATVLQQPGLASRSVQANVDLAQAWWGVPRSERRPRTLAALEELRVGHLRTRSAGSLSGGERRRVHLARGLAVRPDVLLLDEPFAGLDPQSHAALAEDSTTALRAASRAAIVVLHDRADAWALADRLLVMRDGRIVADGAPDALLADPPSAEVARFLGYDGELTSGNTVTLTRPVHVEISTDGDLAAEVTLVVRREDGARVRLRTASGTLWADHRGAGRLSAGDLVRVRVLGGVTYRRPG